MFRQIVLRAGCALIALLLVPATSHAGQVQILCTSGNIYFPDFVQINVGDQVSWVWTGNQHNVVSGIPSTPDGAFNSGGLQNVNATVGTAFTWKSTVVDGSQPFFCVQHQPGMEGTIQVFASGIAVADFRITEVQYSATGGLDRIEISNLGAGDGDLGRFRVSVGTGTQTVVPLNSVPVPPGGRVTIHTHETAANNATNLYMPGLGDLPAVSGSVSLFAPQAQNGALGALSVPLMVDYVEWGAAGRPNESTANTAGFWTTGDFVGGVDNPAYSIAFCGTATDHGVGSWAVALANFSSQPPCSTPVATTSWGRIKTLYR